MTYEQKVSYVRGLSNEELLEQFANQADHVKNIFQYAQRTGLDLKEIYEDFDIYKSEVLSRMH